MFPSFWCKCGALLKVTGKWRWKNKSRNSRDFLWPLALMRSVLAWPLRFFLYHYTLSTNACSKTEDILNFVCQKIVKCFKYCYYYYIDTWVLILWSETTQPQQFKLHYFYCNSPGETIHYGQKCIINAVLRYIKSIKSTILQKFWKNIQMYFSMLLISITTVHLLQAMVPILN